jgi:flagellar biogenesis protein FliO
MATASNSMTESETLWMKARHWLGAFGTWRRSRPVRQLHLRETLALGERRFLAVVEFERQKFLIAGTGSSVSILTALPEKSECGPSMGAVAKLGPRPRAESANREEVPTWQFAAAAGAAQELIRNMGQEER